MNKILVCTDGSAYSFVCYDYAAWMAQRTGAALEVLYVSDLRQFEVPMVADLSGSLGVQPYQAVLGKLQEFEQERAKAILEQARKHLAAKTPPVVAGFTHKLGFLVDTFHDFEAHVDLIMLGKRGENANFATEHLGSTMERVVRASHKPCLVTSRAFKAVERILFAHDGGKSCQKALEFLATSSAFNGTSEDIFANPLHPYTVGLLKSVPRLDSPKEKKLIPIHGLPPDLSHMPSTCAFLPRCPYHGDRCRLEPWPELRFVNNKHATACYVDIAGKMK